MRFKSMYTCWLCWIKCDNSSQSDTEKLMWKRWQRQRRRRRWWRWWRQGLYLATIITKADFLSFLPLQFTAPFYLVLSLSVTLFVELAVQNAFGFSYSVEWLFRLLYHRSLWPIQWLYDYVEAHIHTLTIRLFVHWTLFFHLLDCWRRLLL